MLGSVLLVLSYTCVGVFLAAIVWRAVKIKRLPMHVRWELYPVAHEKGKADYGGSYLEELDWWTKPREPSLIGELKVMLPEIFLLKGVWENNRKHWFRSFPFHFGLYLLAGLVALLLAGGIAAKLGMDVAADAGLLGKTLFYLTCVVGYLGLGLGLLGSVTLLTRRVFDENYSEYTKKGDYFNLAFFVLTLAVALAAHLVADRDFGALRSFVASFATFDFSGVASQTALSALEIALASVLLAYIPLTHMSHFFTKWFMYHDIRWSDEPNLPGGKMEQKIAEVLQYPVSWSASHIRGDGKKTWADVATSGVEEDEE
jgi:nitrate reductase gamma subunit